MALKDFNHNFESETNNKLSVIIMADSFFYAVFNGANQLIAHQSFENLRFSDPTANKPILNDKNLRHPFQEISVLFAQENGFVSSGQDLNSIKLFPGLEHKMVYRAPMASGGLYHYFGVTSHKKLLLDQLFGENNYTLHTAASVLSRWYRFENSDFIHVHIEASYFIIYIQKEGKIVFHNHFETIEANDVLYFILAACRNAELDPQTVKVCVTGAIETDSKLFSNLSSYLAKMKLVSLAEDTDGIEAAPGFSTHHYFLHIANIL